MCFRRPSKIVVPVLTLNGVISDSGSLAFKKQCKLIEQAFKVPHIKTIALVINSPGGSPVQSELIYKRIRALATENEVEVLTFIEDVGASGGYYLALAGDTIYASSSSIVGSIGVVASGFGLHDFIGRHGVERRIYAQGKNKAILDPFLPQKEDDIAILNDISKDVHQAFIDVVLERRGIKFDQSDPDLFSGKIWSGKKAREIGLIDAIGDIHSVLHTKYGKNVELKYITEPKTLMSSLRKAIGLDTLASSIVETAMSRLGVRTQMLMQ